jgi:hypothetical protein
MKALHDLFQYFLLHGREIIADIVPHIKKRPMHLMLNQTGLGLELVTC